MTKGTVKWFEGLWIHHRRERQGCIRTLLRTEHGRLQEP